MDNSINKMFWEVQGIENKNIDNELNFEIVNHDKEVIFQNKFLQPLLDIREKHNNSIIEVFKYHKNKLQ
jgi:hypothetical protein